MKKEIKLVWNVFRYSNSESRVKEFNVFMHPSLQTSMQKWWHKDLSKEEFAERLRGDMFYYYCSKCEHEVVITDFPPHIAPEELERLTAERDEHIAKYGNPQYSYSVRVKNALKIDVYEQIMINWEHFLDYVWNECQKAHKK